MIPTAIPNLSGNEKKYLLDCIETNYVSSVGPYVNKFEELITKKSESLGCVAVSSGTAALHLALHAIGVQHGDLVILPSFTFIATANAVAHCGAEPWILDVSEQDWNLDPAVLQEVLQNETEQINNKTIHKASGKRVTAILPVYGLGLPPDMEKITKIANYYSLAVVADAAAAMGSTIKNQAIGHHGATLTTFSFNGNKTVTCGGGGAIISNNPLLLKKTKHISTTARIDGGYNHDEVGFNYRLTNVQAALGCGQVEQLESFLAIKESIRNFYCEAFKNIDGLSAFPAPEGRKSAYWLSGVYFRDRPKGDMIKCLESLQENDIEAKLFWKPIHLQKPYQSCFRSTVNVANNIWDRILVLPCSTNITKIELEKVANSIHATLKKL
ncbi:aminotransferase class I/II-fold pyridoxal phosphate-dependent enzyme [Candidatus Nucleicultrix amoebiphila]|jgi:aminotransferase in exopolysaccharide biosynthesis|uniref:Aminotransferase DegT n=1 Tax=Candidatus Nucleicultrix amoebiphila FS5 TaxID=1414854 RepID=A0A1W6N5C3_9PROT|nr:aminotransferase class I/II-fold pyridoxal phosphate-dependent enzyme [Candidatus Nucleicultrix amoebiphila]ARN85064.1 hypothetical protein GQ61_06910 [Candidatus Nucleicultrix amoebiphila FS5]